MIVNIIDSERNVKGNMTPLEQKTKKAILKKISIAVNKVLSAPQLEEIDSKLIEKIADRYYADGLLEEFSKEVKKFKLDEKILQNYIERWLGGFESKHTRRSFRKNIELFLKWLNQKSVIEVDAFIVDLYLTELKADKLLSASTIRQRIAAPSSFWSMLVRWEVVNRNPFTGINGLPKKKIKIKQSFDIPTNKELDDLEKHAEQMILSKGKGSSKKIEGARLALCALKLLRATGLRVGALQYLVIDGNGCFKSVSKGQEIQGRIDASLIELFVSMGLDKRRPFKNYSGNAFRLWLYRVLTSIELKEKMGGKIYSPHSLRHRFSIDFYLKNFDVNELSRRLGHSSLIATTAYLSGLKCEIDNAR